ncbi:MAG TPA: alpha-D-glucose phosphate-specific phosphoglucomutase, partial [Marinobacter sp.]|nr:alpha-D-glucose phosphate-specific phosphoglucomutase [Marinobacter sp.]
DPSESYEALAREFGNPVSERFEAAATPAQKDCLAKLSADQIQSSELAGEKILSVLTKAPGNNAPIGGVRVSAQSGWFAARPSGTEDIYKIYAESFQGKEHLQQILTQAQTMVDAALQAKSPSSK